MTLKSGLEITQDHSNCCYWKT